MAPNTAQEWIDVAKERAADVEALKQRLNPVGAVYMAGYAIDFNSFSSNLGVPERSLAFQNKVSL
jgi:hypothetical protein